MPSPRTKPSLTSLFVFVMIIVSPLVYVLSYAPVVRVCRRTVVVAHEDPVCIADASLYPAYKPVDWMIDDTPLRRPLIFWAGLWGVRGEFTDGFVYRSLYREGVIQIPIATQSN